MTDRICKTFPIQSLNKSVVRFLMMSTGCLNRAKMGRHLRGTLLFQGAGFNGADQSFTLFFQIVKPHSTYRYADFKKLERKLTKASKNFSKKT